MRTHGFTVLACFVTLSACGSQTSETNSPAPDGASDASAHPPSTGPARDGGGDDGPKADHSAREGGADAGTPSGRPDASLPDASLPGACIEVTDGYGPPGTTPLAVDVVAGGLEIPWGLAFLAADDFLVTERAGRIRRIVAGALVTAPVLTLAVDAYEAGGLLDVILDPDFATSRALFIYANVRTDSGEHVSRVMRYTLTADSASATFEKVLIEVPRFHNGGRLRFGPDGKLYVGTGDDHERLFAQDPTSAQGKILRLEKDGAIPPDNPWQGLPAYLIGLRNPQSFDWLDDGSMVVLDNGPSGELNRTGHDEVNIVGAGEAGANLGWPTIYGCETATDASVPLRAPALTWSSAVPPSGASIFRGDGIPAFKGDLLVTTLRSEHLHRVMFDKATPHRIIGHEVYFPRTYGRLRGGLTGPDGAFYVVTGNCDSIATCPVPDRLLRVHAP